MYARLPIEIRNMIDGFVLGGRVYDVTCGFRESFSWSGRRLRQNELLLLAIDVWTEDDNDGGEEALRYQSRWVLRSLPPLMMTDRQHWEDGKRHFFGLNRFNFRDCPGVLEVIPEELFFHCQHIGLDQLHNSLPWKHQDLVLLHKFKRLERLSVLIGYDGLQWITDCFDPPSNTICCQVRDSIITRSLSQFPVLPPSITHIHFRWDLELRENLLFPGASLTRGTLDERSHARLRHGRHLIDIHRKCNFPESPKKLHHTVKSAIESPLRQKLLQCRSTIGSTFNSSLVGT